MFLQSYEELRRSLINDDLFISLLHPGRGIFGSDFGTTTFVLAKKYVRGYIASFRRLFNKPGEVENWKSPSNYGVDYTRMENLLDPDYKQTLLDAWKI